MLPHTTTTLPAMPERAIRPNDDNTRTSEESERRRLVRLSQYSTNTVVPSIMERPSEEVSDRGFTPSRQAMTQWAPPSGGLNITGDSPQVQQEARPAGNNIYGRTTSNDYTMYGEAPTPTPANGADPYTANGGPQFRAGEENYFQRPYRRAGPPSIRETTETGSLKTGRYAPLVSGKTLKKQVSIGHTRTHYADGYEPSIDVPEEVTPQKPPPIQRRGTSLYLVRDGGDGRDGSPPPSDLLRLPLTSWLKGPIRNHFVAFLGEFVGTTMFLFFAFAGTLVANIGAKESSNTTTAETAGFSPIVNLYVAVSFGFALMVNVWIFFRVSGGLFNPAVTLGMVMTKTINYIRGFLLVIAQLTGAIFASFLVQILFPSNFNVRTTLSSSTSVARGVFIEAVLTAELVFTVFMLAKEKHKATYMAPVGIGLALFVAELVGVFFTGGSLNPARSFGPCVTTGQFDAEHWIYWVGPALGAIAAVAFYRFIKILEYEMTNPGQDHNAEEAEAASIKAKSTRGAPSFRDTPSRLEKEDV